MPNRLRFSSALATTHHAENIIPAKKKIAEWRSKARSSSFSWRTAVPVPCRAHAYASTPIWAFTSGRARIIGANWAAAVKPK
jgi:hypothetical protein